MRQPDEITTSMRARFERDYPDWARGRGTWPIRIPLKPPTSAERSTDLVACHAWAKLWDHYTGTGTIERSTLRFPTGLHGMPKTLVLESPLAAASIHPSTRQTLIRCGERLMHLQRMRLHERLGLRVPPDLIQIAVLDPEMRSMVGGLHHFAASVEDLNASGLRPRTVVILENKETGYAITGDLAGTVVCHGAGFSIVNYARVTWIRNAPQVIYWGDIDAPGLQFVRGLGIAARTVLMDRATLERYRHLAVTGAGPARQELPNLKLPEQQLYEHLVQHAADHGTGLLLEQERIPWAHAYQQLTDAIETSASLG